MKVKIFKNFSYGDLEKDINDFIEDKSIEDVKFIEKGDFYCAMVLYSEYKSNTMPINKEVFKELF